MNRKDRFRSNPKHRQDELVRGLRTGFALACAAVLSACAGFSPDGGMSVVADIAGRELDKDAIAIRTPQDATSVRARVEHLLERPLSADSAVQIALLTNRGLQAAYNELGVAEAVLVQASLPPNPSFSFSRIAGPLESALEARIAANILALATLPARAEIAADRFHQAQLRAAEETLRLAAEARRNYYRAVAALELVGFLTQANSSAEAAAKIGRTLGETGAMNKLDQAREQVFYADLTTQLARARQRALSERERLTRSLGLWGGDLDFKLVSGLPLLSARPRSGAMVEREAVGRRVDLQIARIELEALAKSYGLTNATRFVNLLQLSGIYKDTRENVGDEHVRFLDFGPAATVEIPIFDLGEARVRQAEQAYMIAVNRLAQRAVAVRSEVRAAYQLYRSTYDITSHYQREVLPLRKIISDESLRRFNTMQIDVFPLLDEARRRILATSAAIEAKRDFWIATTDLQVAILGGGDTSSLGESSRPTSELEQITTLKETRP
ncbi:copper resistance protein [Methylocystis sp. MitZ-2018]|nr:copper resistance protein [Hyphomicrobium sp.]PWB90125.1 copper resistance protein [Methylocystis sp. MitZ-2018]